MGTKKSTKTGAKKTSEATKQKVDKAEPKKLSALDAAARVLGETRQAMSCAELIEAMAAKDYWSSPAGKTPQATLYAAIQREIVVKKGQSRFKKSAPGRFALA